MIYLLLPIAFIPMIIAFIWIRNTEHYNRESLFPLIFVFMWGAAAATIISLILENFVSSYITSFFILSVLIAPIVEELSKVLGIGFVKNKINEIEDGLIYGAMAGLGFAATENLIYGLKFWDDGFIVILSLFYIRTVGSGLLHASASGISGYGISNKIIKKKPLLSIIPFILLSIAIHSIFNLFAFSAQMINQIFGVVFAVLFAVSLIIWIRKKVIFLDNNVSVSKKY